MCISTVSGILKLFRLPVAQVVNLRLNRDYQINNLRYLLFTGRLSLFLFVRVIALSRRNQRDVDGLV
jgi:hypothetical protein